jgi:hypothetical protein
MNEFESIRQEILDCDNCQDFGIAGESIQDAEKFNWITPEQAERLQALLDAVEDTYIT